MRNWILIIFITLTSQIAHATIGSSGLLLSFNAFMKDTNTEQDGVSSESNEKIYDLKFGYSGSSNLYYGLIYTTRSQTGSAISSTSGTALGPSFGYIGNSGFFIMGHYFLQAQNADYSDGSGYQLDFGYLAKVSGAFHVGVELTYRNLSYKKLNSETMNSPLTVKEMFPMLTAAFAF